MTLKNQFLIKSLLIFSIGMHAQVGIGNNSPDSTSLLDISSDNKGITIPQTALTSVDTKAPITNAVNGLIIYNTTEDSSSSLYKGLYYWSDENNSWQNLMVNDHIPDAFLNFGLEQPYVIANEMISQSFINNTATQLTFSSTSILLNKENSFTTGTDSYFTVPVTGRYSIYCGMDVALKTTTGSENSTIYLQFYPNGSSTEDTTKRVVSTKQRDYILTYLTPVSVYSGSLSQGDIVRCTGTYSLSSNGDTRIKYFYVKKF